MNSLFFNVVFVDLMCDDASICVDSVLGERLKRLLVLQNTEFES